VVNELRARQRRNFIATLLTSHGIPMLLGGDELGRTQGGNNNAYCQDNEVSWYDWGAADAELSVFTRRAIALRRSHPVLRRRKFALGSEPGEEARGQIAMLRADGAFMTDGDWDDHVAKALMVWFNGRRPDEPLEPELTGESRPDGRLLLALNASELDLDFVLPGPDLGANWRVALATDTVPEWPDRLAAGEKLGMRSLSLVVLEAS
jgi:glycogen operon protein